MGERIADTDGVQREYNWGEVEPAVAILESIAVLEYADPAKAVSVLEEPLGTVIETDALDTLVRGENTMSVTLSVADYHVQINGNTVGVSRTDH